MATLLRPCSGALAMLLANGNLPKLWSADLFTFTLVDGTVYYWTGWTNDIDVGAITYISNNPVIARSKWSITNKMAVPSLTIKISATNASWNGGASLKTQIHNGLFDGAAFDLQRAFMVSPGDTSTFGAIDIFGGYVSSITLDGLTAEVTIKGKNNTLDQYIPRNIFQTGCNHAFCDAGCTLLRATYTASYTVGSGPSSIFIPWSGSPPSNYAKYLYGTMTLTGGAGAGQKRTISAASNTGLTLIYPLYITPAPGDAFTAFQGCTKAFNDGSGQDCTGYSNTQHYRGFPYVPPPDMAY